MSDQYTETTTTGWGQRIVGSFVAVIFGLILVPVSIGLLYWNEGRAVQAIQALNRGASSIVEVNPDTVDPQANGKLVHVTGTMQPTTPARDPVFGVTDDGLLRLSRAVEMYQWKEDSNSQSQQSLGGSKTTTTTYTYQKVWSDQLIQSGQFKVQDGHQNPPMPIQSSGFNAAGVKLGAYQVDASLLNKVSAFTPVQIQSAAPAGYQQSGNSLYKGRDPSQPSIGDIRVTFSGTGAQTFSVAAAQSNGVLTAFRDSGGYTIALAEPGLVTASALFHDEQQSENRLTWILRAVGFVAMLIGFICLTAPLTTLFAVVPFLESLVGAGAFLIALTLAVPVTLLTIALAWIAHRPLIGVGLLVVAAVAIYLLRLLHPKRQPATA